MKRLLCVLPLLALTACLETGRRFVELDVRGEGVEAAAFDAGEWTVSLDVAEIGIGPLYLCATEAADPEFCETASLELIETITIDGRDPTPRTLGTAHGVTGTVRSAMWDYGISWWPTSRRPRANAGAPGGHSARFEGRASHPDGRSFAFAADLDLPPLAQGELRVRGRRIAARELTGEERALRIAVDPRQFFRRIDLARLAARAEAGEDPVVLVPTDPDYEALVVAMTAAALPTIDWE